MFKEMKSVLKYTYAGMAALMLMAGGCSKENPFGPEENSATGRVVTSALKLQLENEGTIPAVFNRPATRAAAPTADDFTLNFYPAEGGNAVKTYRFGDMPEVIELPAGAYKAVAHYGDNLPADWEAPHFRGETSFIVVANAITDEIEPITASLANVRVTILFDPSLRAKMGEDAKVTVKVGDTGTLDFRHSDAERSGYFAYVEDSKSLTATFSGTVEGLPVTETKGYGDVAPGTHYKITFKLHGADNGESNGTLGGSFAVDATVETQDMNVNVDPEDMTVEDDMRPVEGGQDTPTPPTPPTPGNEDAPVIAAASPAPDSEFAGYKPCDLSKTNVITSDLYCVLNVKSSAEGGIKDFTVDIESAQLTPEELQGVGLNSHLDLVNPGSLEGPLSGLGFPVNVGGKDDVDFSITGFLPMLQVLGAGVHKFHLHVTDANGTTNATLILETL